jgi:hypothetical protein
LRAACAAKQGCFAKKQPALVPEQVLVLRFLP